MKFSYEEPHVWYQFALSLIETGKVGLEYQTPCACSVRIKPTEKSVITRMKY